MEGTIAIIAGNIMIVSVVLAVVWGGVQSRREMNETMRKAIDGGQTLDPETIAALNKPGRSPQQDLRGGVILGFLALGLIAAGLMASGLIPSVGKGWDEDAGVGFFIAASIVGAIGVGQFVAAMMRREKK